MWAGVRFSLAGVALLAGFAAAQQTPFEAGAGTVGGANSQALLQPSVVTRSHSPWYQDMDLLRRDGFAEARTATVTLRVASKDGSMPGDLQDADIALTVNGTVRPGRLRAPGGLGAQDVAPVVLLVFPPNQPIVHHIALRQAERYFSQLGAEVLPWKVGLFDSNGKLTPFTNGRSQLLVNLDVLEHTIEPFEYSNEGWLPAGFQTNGRWLSKAEESIATMQRLDGPKVILAMNPLSDPLYGLNEGVMAHVGPESLTEAALHSGAHIYVANVGGPEALVPGGEAAQGQAAQLNSGAIPFLLGTVPSGNQQINSRQMTALSYFAYRTGQMMQTASDTRGGFANSLDELARKIHHDLDENYALDFDLTAEDRDHGVPDVGVKLVRHDLRVAILDVVPIRSEVDANRQQVSKEHTELVTLAAKHPVTSADFRITQHVDYFPLQAGLRPVLPMSCIVEWTGRGRGPERLAAVESVEDLDLATLVLERDIQANWDGRSLSWERDGQLRPGRYAWRIAVHDGKGTILASREEKFTVGLPRQANLAVSSLVLSKSCRGDAESSHALERRTSEGGKEQVKLQADPMRTADCRLKPEPTERFAATDMLHALVRIYPAEKLDKHGPESWTAKFVLRSEAGVVEAEREMTFAVDSGSGYLAAIAMPLNVPEIKSGRHTLDVQMMGPGIRRDIRESRTISIF